MSELQAAHSKPPTDPNLVPGVHLVREEVAVPALVAASSLGRGVWTTLAASWAGLQICVPAALWKPFGQSTAAVTLGSRAYWP